MRKPAVCGAHVVGAHEASAVVIEEREHRTVPAGRPSYELTRNDLKFMKIHDFFNEIL